MYLTYSEYTTLGGNQSQAEFTRNEYAARKEIDRLTHNRLKGLDPVPEDLKMCVMELAQRGLTGNLDGDDFTSESSGKLSGSREGRQKRIYEITRRYLGGMSVNGVPVFYCGAE